MSGVEFFINFPYQEQITADVTSRSAADPFEIIRELDENERWTDRNWVITAPQHQDNIRLVKQILDDIIDNLPVAATTEETVAHSAPTG